jgi:hypothetical protein
VDPAVLDTDVASLLHKGTLAGPLATRLIGHEPLITFVTFGELAKWAEIRDWGQHRREELTSWLSHIAVLPGDEAVAATWGSAVRGSRPAWTTTAGQRHVGRGLLPAIMQVPADAWKPSTGQDGAVEHDKAVAEITDLMSRAGNGPAGCAGSPGE